jgi:hypothetical protein
MSTAAVVVDTNVAVVANDASRADPEWPAACVLACIEAIERVMSVAQPIAIDELGLIINEYLSNLHMAGQPGIGDQFVKWVHDNQGRPETCVRVAINPTEGSFDELSTELTELVDPSDRKFVAVAIAHGKATILEATDSKWWGWQEQLRAAGALVEFVCPDLIAELHEKKMG